MSDFRSELVTAERIGIWRLHVCETVYSSKEYLNASADLLWGLNAYLCFSKDLVSKLSIFNIFIPDFGDLRFVY